MHVSRRCRIVDGVQQSGKSAGIDEEKVRKHRGRHVVDVESFAANEERAHGRLRRLS
jgi:hypothetical protein